VDAAYHIVFALTNVLTPVLGGLAAVVGIVVCTAAVRLLVTPLTFRALRGQAAQARLAPEIQRLRQRYAKKPDRLQRELTALYQREGTSMFAGFAPLLAQWPVFSVLYLLFRSPTVGGAPNRLLSRDLLGVPLGSHWLSGAGALSLHGAVFLGVLAVLAAACWLAARSARRALPQTAMASQAAGGAASSPQALTAVTKVLPYITVLIAAFAPLAGAIYLVTTTGWSAAERLVFAARTGRPAESQPGTDAAGAGRPAGNSRKPTLPGSARPAETERKLTGKTDSGPRPRPRNLGVRG
jgi:YidC/Oxa1 family membrane protein insertase